MLKKIGIDIRCLLERNRSGVGEYTYNLLDAIFKLDKKNEYFLFCNSFFLTAQPVEPLEQWNYPNVHFCGFKFPNKLFNTSLKFFKYPKIDKLLANDIDVFLTPNLNFISLSSRCKKIIIAHDISYEIYPEFYSPKSRLWHKFINPKKLYKDANQIIAVSKNTARDLNDIYNIPQDKIKVVYPGINYRSPTSIIKKDFILYLGNVEPRKNIEGLIKAFESMGNRHACSLLIAGAPGYKSRHFCNARYKSVKFLGYVAAKDRVELYKSAKLFVFPSYYEGFGFPPLEAMAHGTPVVSSISSSLVEVVGNAGLLIDPYNINELAWAMNEMLINQELRNEMIQRGYERVKMFNWEKTARAVLKLM